MEIYWLQYNSYASAAKVFPKRKKKKYDNIFHS